MAYGKNLTKLSPCGSELVLSLLREVCPDPRMLLDAGCGRGDRLADCAAANPGTRLFGIDCDEENAGIARLACPGAEIVIGDICALPWPDGIFDAALCECTLSLSEAPEACLAELFRVLRPGGALLLSDLCVGTPEALREQIGAAGAVRFLASRAWHEAAVRAAGFRILRFRDCREEYLTMAAQMIFDGDCGCLGPGAFDALREKRAGYGLWLLERGEKI